MNLASTNQLPLKYKQEGGGVASLIKTLISKLNEQMEIIQNQIKWQLRTLGLNLCRNTMSLLFTQRIEFFCQFIPPMNKTKRLPPPLSLW